MLGVDAKKRELGEGGRDARSPLDGCRGMVSGSGSSLVWKGLATEVPSNNRWISLDPSSPKEVSVLTSRRGELADIKRQ